MNFHQFQLELPELQESGGTATKLDYGLHVAVTGKILGVLGEPRLLLLIVSRKYKLFCEAW